MSFNMGVDMAKMVDELPAGLDRAVLRVLSFHVGRDQAISRGDLVVAIAQHGYFMHERAVRAAINLLRKQGQPICSTGGEDGGYWLAKDWDELDEFIVREFHSRAMDLLEQEGALRKKGEELWGAYSPGKQMRLEI
jgi:hypothetical protein